MLNLVGGHLGFFSKGVAYNFGSKFQISSKSVYGLIGPGNDVGDVLEQKKALNCELNSFPLSNKTSRERSQPVVAYHTAKFNYCGKYSCLVLPATPLTLFLICA